MEESQEICLVMEWTLCMERRIRGLGFRVLSGMKLPYEKMNGGYASHFGINPNYFRADSFGEKG